MKHLEELQQIWSIQRKYNRYEAFKEELQQALRETTINMKHL